jgi:hypothetical protein
VPVATKSKEGEEVNVEAFFCWSKKEPGGLESAALPPQTAVFVCHVTLSKKQLPTELSRFLLSQMSGFAN